MNFLLTDLSSAQTGDLYRSLARVSGGQAVEITEQQFPQAASIITDSLSPALVEMLDFVTEFSLKLFYNYHRIAQPWTLS